MPPSNEFICDCMTTNDVNDTLNLALENSGFETVNVKHRPWPSVSSDEVGQERTLASLDEKPDDLEALKDMNQAENNRRTTSVILLCIILYV